MNFYSVFWSINTACQWEKVPLSLSSPQSHTLIPSYKREPKRSCSAVAHPISDSFLIELSHLKYSC